MVEDMFGRCQLGPDWSREPNNEEKVYPRYGNDDHEFRRETSIDSNISIRSLVEELWDGKLLHR
jgi:hypothetical protein